jgi:hypothetical protein
MGLLATKGDQDGRPGGVQERLYQNRSALRVARHGWNSPPAIFQLCLAAGLFGLVLGAYSGVDNPATLFVKNNTGC